MRTRTKPKPPPSKKRVIFLVLMALLLISGAMMFNAPKQTEIIEVRFPSGAKLQAEVADTPEKLLFGLAFREGLPEDKDSKFSREWPINILGVNT